MKKYKLISESSDLPVALADFKEHVNFSGTSKDDNFTLLLRAAAREAESFTGRQLMPATYELQLPDFPESGFVTIGKAPVTGISSVKYFNASNEETELVSGTDYYTDVVAEPAEVHFYNTYPVYDKRAGNIIIEFDCGYADAEALPYDIRAAVMLAAADLYVNPSDAVRNISTKSKALLRNYRLFMDG